MDQFLMEGCVDSVFSAMAAVRGGADRLELCGQLPVGGVTPSRTLCRQVKELCRIPVNVLIRPRAGDFLYDDWELAELEEEIRGFRKLGADGIVTGVLTEDGALDTERMKRLMDAAGDLPVTLHRAFDMTRDPFEALEAAIRLGCRTILTSGQAESAVRGAALLKELRERAAGRITIMAGCGVRSGNIRDIYEASGVTVFHATGRRGAVESGMRYRRAGVSMGLPGLSEYELWRTDEAELRACAVMVHSLREEAHG